ncbi:hypothetical protein [Oenococcus oeni]|uniref:hypothetical protein n=1 Tax=Oenococcus oeni TaxID=1247 RepID=UPI0005101055|nr:hypothetical protein [Oenococcus oeni]KGI00296.1 hypothetical protein X293_08885 [Oenococcus oeni IOEB_C52]
MKGKTIVGLTVLGLVFVVSLGGNIYQHSQNNQAKQQISNIKKQNKQVKKKLSKVKQQKELLAGQINSYKTYQNNKGKSESETNFNTVANKFFNVMNNFEPKSYGNRKEAVKDLISTDLYKQYFSDKGTYGDSNSVSSKLDKVNIYTQSKQGQSMKGLAVVTFESKSGDNDWQKSTVLYQLTFDTTTNRITDVQNLGNNFKASDLD